MAQLGLFAQESAPPTRYETIPVYRVSLVREGAVQAERPQLKGSASAHQVLQAYLADTDREHFVVLMLDRKNRLIGLNTVSVGSLTASVVHPREVWKPVILANAAAVIFGHNHPSGDPAPSQEDRALTTRLVDAGTLLGIQVLDHVIIGDDTYYSFADEGMLYPHGWGLRPLAFAIRRSHMATPVNKRKRTWRRKRVQRMAETVEPLAPVVHAGPGRGKKLKPKDRATQGNRSVYLVRRIARDRPDILAQMKQGEFTSVRQAEIAAGFIKHKEPPTP